MASIVSFVLVYDDTYFTEEMLAKLNKFKENLSEIGIKLETVEYSANSDIKFIKLIASDEVIIKYARICDVYLACKTFEFRPTLKPPLPFMSTPLTNPHEEDEIYQRAPEYFSGEIPKTITSAERILVLENLMLKVKFGEEKSEFGYHKLLRDKILIDVFPLHNEFLEWTETGPLTDRQLLYRYWGNFKCWYKEQPLNLIERYFGSQYAFYFAWLGFYTKMLCPIAILSLLSLFYGILTIDTRLNGRSHQICNSEVIMCPKCHYLNCKFEKLSNSCVQSHLTYLFDNPASLVLAVIVMFWSTIFMEFWQRNEAVLQLQWNVKDVELDTSLRNEYVEASTTVKYSLAREVYVPHIVEKYIVKGYVISVGTVIFLLIFMLLGVCGVIVYRLSISFFIIRNEKHQLISKNYNLIASATGACISAVFIILVKMIYVVLAKWLTNMENHRTEVEFDKSFIYKLYGLAFTNNYAPVFYIAFLKGRFYTHPGDMTLWDKMGGIASDTCDPTGCILDLGIQLICIMLMKIIVSNVRQVFIPILMRLYKKIISHISIHQELPVYEEEYLMESTDKYFLIDEYLDMVIQYGFVVFFVAGFPLAPILAFINNILEIRVDSYKLIKDFRRPVPTKVAGLGAWFNILQGITYLGVATNAVVIAFLSNAIPVMISGESQFLNESLSEFAISDFQMIRSSSENDIDNCLYQGRRYPPDHRNKYELTGDFWYLLTFRFVIVLAFEHIVLFLNGILAYAIPNVPSQVTEQLIRQERKDKEMRLQMLSGFSVPDKYIAGPSYLGNP